MKAPQPVAALPKLPSVIDTLSAAFQLLNRHLYLLLAPIALDLFYWLGPRLSIQPVAERAVKLFAEAAASPELGVTTAQATQSVEMIKSGIQSMGASLNLFTLLSGSLSIPSLLSSQDLQAPAGLVVTTTHSVASFGELLSLMGLLFVLGVAIGAAYLGLAAQIVRDGRTQPGVLAQRILAYAVRYIQLLLVFVLVALVIGLPASLILGVAALLSPLLGSVLIMIVWTFILWLYVSLFFTVDALFISEAGPLRAVRSSITAVRLSTSSAIGLIILSVVISLGMSYVWSALGPSEIAALASILGNAYIGSGLVVASMIFYRDRINALINMQKAAASTPAAGDSIQ